MKSIYEQALAVALGAHALQVRKSDNSPYVIHPICVAKTVIAAGGSDVAATAALLHDVLEDTAVTLDSLLQQFGAEVVRIVTAVTEDKHLSWENRKERYVESVVRGGVDVWLVSVADKIHNAESLLDAISEQGENAWSVFNRDKNTKLWFEKLLHSELSKVWDSPLLDTYGQLIAELETAK